MPSELKNLLDNIAPTMSLALDTPLKGHVINVIGSAFGLGNGVTESQVEEVLQTLTLEQIANLKQIDLEFATNMEELGIDVRSLVDKKDSSDSPNENKFATSDLFVPRVLALGAISFFTIVLIGTFVLAILPGIEIKSEVAYLLGGAQSGAAVLAQNCYNYYFGNNSESNIRDQMIYHARPINVETRSCSTRNNELELG